jgi:hypothetical protein
VAAIAVAGTTDQIKNLPKRANGTQMKSAIAYCASIACLLALCLKESTEAFAQDGGRRFKVVYECTDFDTCSASCFDVTAGGAGEPDRALRSRDIADQALQFRFVQIERVFWGNEPAYLAAPLEGPVMVRFMWSHTPVPDRAVDHAGYYAVDFEMSLVFFNEDSISCQFQNLAPVDL